VLSRYKLYHNKTSGSTNATAKTCARRNVNLWLQVLHQIALLRLHVISGGRPGWGMILIRKQDQIVRLTRLDQCVDHLNRGRQWRIDIGRSVDQRRCPFRFPMRRFEAKS
jgi:hypothetical protein